MANGQLTMQEQYALYGYGQSTARATDLYSRGLINESQFDDYLGAASARVRRLWSKIEQAGRVSTTGRYTTLPGRGGGGTGANGEARSFGNLVADNPHPAVFGRNQPPDRTPLYIGLAALGVGALYFANGGGGSRRRRSRR